MPKAKKRVTKRVAKRKPRKKKAGFLGGSSKKKGYRIGDITKFLMKWAWKQQKAANKRKR